jgi:hypothetical protein
MKNWTPEEYHEYTKTGRMPDGTQAKRSNKFGAKRTEYRGKVYDSQKEANRAAELRLLEQAGEIAGYAEQVPFLLAGGIVYKADFVVLGLDGTYRIEDTKGGEATKTPGYRMKKKLMADKGLKIVEV